jgi:hypothetical protein
MYRMAQPIASLSDELGWQHGKGGQTQNGSAGSERCHSKGVFVAVC